MESDPTAGVGILAALGAGLVSFASPCVLPLVPGYLSAVSGVSIGELDQVGWRRVLGPSLIFVASFSAIFILLGLTATGIGQTLQQHRDLLETLAGTLIIGLGFFFVASLLLVRLNREWHIEALMSRAGTGGPMVAGAAFAIAWTPCIGPTLGAILTAASLSTSAAHGALLLAVYSAGLGIPFLATALAFSRMTRLSNEHGGGVGRAQSLPRDQPQHLALRVAQLRKGSGDLAALRQDVGWIAAEIDPCGGQAIEQPGPSLRRAPTIGDHSVADAEQPWERRLRHLIATSPRDRESLSEDIIGSAEILNSPNHIDEFGHAVGDQALARLASVLRERVRSTDVVGRLGGDELTVLMPHADEEQAATLAVALLEKVRRECTVTASGRSMPITVSIGIGHFGHGLGLDPEQALRSADLAMYEAKEAGRDRVRVNRSTLGAAASWDTGSPPPPGSGGDRAPSSASPRA